MANLRKINKNSTFVYACRNVTRYNPEQHIKNKRKRHQRATVCRR